MEKRIRILARVLKNTVESDEVVRMRCKDHEIFAASDPDENWLKENIPCMTACPAHTRIPEYLEAVYKGDFNACYKINREDNIFADSLGRVCAHPCESVCRHGVEGLGDPVSICWSKRTGADFRTVDPELSRVAIQTGKRVAVVGAGPAGLTIANDLALRGHAVTVYEEFAEPGGMLTAGIPPFRLPRDQVKKEIQSILDLGVELKLNRKIGNDMSLKQLQGEYDAVCLTNGCMDPVHLNIPGEELEGHISGLDFMIQVNQGSLEKISGTVVVVGGGFTAMDCSRASLRMGADKVMVIYRRTRNELLIDDREMREASLEGVEFYFLVSPLEVLSSDGKKLDKLRCIKNKLGEPDADGRRRPIPIEGTEFTIDLDWLVPAVSQRPDPSFIPPDLGIKLENGKALVNKEFMTSVGGVFGCGDFIRGPRDLITVIGEGHIVSGYMNKYLTGQERNDETYSYLQYRQIGIRTIDQWRARNQFSYDVIPRAEIDTVKKEERKGIAQEVDLGYTEEPGKEQAERCYFCNHNIQFEEKECILCANCVDVCPLYCIKIADEDQVIVRPPGGGEAVSENRGVFYMLIDEDKCIRCGLCIDVCPTACISMVKFNIHRDVK